MSDSSNPSDLFLTDQQAVVHAADESARHAALMRLLQRLAQSPSSSPTAPPQTPCPLELPADLQPLLERAIHNALLDLWLDVLLEIHLPHDLPPSFSQKTLEDLLQQAIQFRPLREQVFAWALAGLDGRLFSVMSRRAGLRRRLAVTGLRAFAALSPFLPRRPSRASYSPQVAFGRTLLSLLFRSTRSILPDEFTALCRRMDEWAAAFDSSPQADTHNPFDLLATLLPARLTADQAAALHDRLLTWTARLVPRFPFLAEPAADGLARLAQQYPTLPAAADAPPRSLLDDLLRFLDSLPADADSNRLLGYSVRVDDFWTRRALLRALPAFLSQADSLLRWQALLQSKGYKALADAPSLPADASFSPSHQVLQDLFDLIAGGDAPWVRQIFGSMSLLPEVESWLGSHLAHERRLPVLEALTDLHRAACSVDHEFPRLTNALRLAIQSLLTSPQPQISLPALSWLLEQGDTPLAVLLRALRETWPQDDAPALRKVLRALGQVAPSAARDASLSRLSPIGYVACLLIHPDDPLRDGRPLSERLAQVPALLRSSRLDDAHIAWLERFLRPQTDEDLWARLEREKGPYEWKAAHRRPHLLPVLLEPLGDELREGAAGRLAAVRLLERADVPQVIPLLRQAFDLAVSLWQTWAESGSPEEGYYFSEFYREANQLAPAVLHSLAAYGDGTHPFDARALALLEDILTTPARLGILRRSLSPAFVQVNIWPRLAQHKRLAPDALPALWDALTRALERLRPDRPAEERQNAELCLQAYALLLTHVPAPLDEAGRHRLLRALQGDPAQPGHSFESLSRALLLVALARERPLPAATLRLLLEWLTASPLALYRRRQAEWRHHAPSFPDQAGDIFLVQGVAVVLAADCLQESAAGSLPPQAPKQLLDALRRLATPYNRAVEALLTRSTHPLLEAESSPARVLASLLSGAPGLAFSHDADRLARPADPVTVDGGAERAAERLTRDADWLARPADLAYWVLMRGNG